MAAVSLALVLALAVGVARVMTTSPSLSSMRARLLGLSSPAAPALTPPPAPGVGCLGGDRDLERFIEHRTTEAFARAETQCFLCVFARHIQIKWTSDMTATSLEYTPHATKLKFFQQEVGQEAFVVPATHSIVI
jgi:hypothetical protein